MLEMMLISKIIFTLKVPREMKTRIQACVTYGVQVQDRVDLELRLQECFKKAREGKMR